MNLLSSKGGVASLDLGKFGSLGVVRSETGWDTGYFRNMGATVDVDSAVLAVTGDFNNPHTLRAISPYLTESLAFHSNSFILGGAVRHGGDDLSGDGDRREPDEVITIDTNLLPESFVTRDGVRNRLDGLICSVNIHGGDAKNQEFNEIKDVFWRLVAMSGQILGLRDVDDELWGQRSGFVGGLQRDFMTGSWKAVRVDFRSPTELGNGLLQQFGITGR
jgi:stress response protein SCP2